MPDLKNLSVPTTLARIMAVTALYHRYQNPDVPVDEEPDNNVVQFYQEIAMGEDEHGDTGGELDKFDRSHFKRIVTGIPTIREQIDARIGEQLKTGWSLERLGALEYCLLCAGVYELYAEQPTPTNVIISEYVAISELFVDEVATKLINGMLDTIAGAVRD